MKGHYTTIQNFGVSHFFQQGFICDFTNTLHFTYTNKHCSFELSTLNPAIKIKNKMLQKSKI